MARKSFPQACNKEKISGKGMGSRIIINHSFFNQSKLKEPQLARFTQFT